jgi:DNA polymerase elongation subunit (family B)/ribonuclease HI
MSRFEAFDFYSYLWTSNDEDSTDGKQCVIRAYGWNGKGEPTYVKISDVLLPQIVELDDSIEWTDGLINMVCSKLRSLSRLPEFRPRTIVTKELARSYYAFVEKNTDLSKGAFKYKHKKFQYLVPCFASEEACGRFAADIKRGIDVAGIGKVYLKCHRTSKTITPDMKFRGIRELPTCGWMKATGIRMTPDEKESTRKNEYAVSYTDLKALAEEESMKMPIIFPKIMAFDNEANSTYMNSMPKPKRPGDKTFQIGFTIVDPPKDGASKQYRKYLISMGELDPIEGVTVIPAKSEADVYVLFAEKLREEDPEIVIGYNILGWDMNYMITRCEDICRCMGEFDQMGCLVGRHSAKDEVSWGSSGAGKNKFKFLKVEGRVFIDLLPYIKRNHKLPNYRLETVCDEFLKTNKDPVKPKEIFKAWRKWLASYADPNNTQLRKESRAELARIGKYCAKDAEVCILLFEKLCVWADLTESATVCQVNIFDMFARGQQLKMFAQVYRYCFKNDIAVEMDAYKAKDDEFYEGAYVGEPKRGLYKKIVPMDFQSLYPSLMQAFNIDYGKLVLDPKIPDEDCHVMIWSSHQYCKCEKDEFPGQKAPKMKDGRIKRVCAEYKYRWLKHEVSGRGIIPTLLSNLLAARKKTRKNIAINAAEIKYLKGEILNDEDQPIFEPRLEAHKSGKELNPAIAIILKGSGDRSEQEKTLIKERIEALENLNLVLDRRQNAYKVNANSMYGAMGVREGYLPFLPGAMCVTYMGRTYIHRANKFIEEEKGGIVIYNDTDSSYCRFPQFDDKPVKELWAHAKQLAIDIKRILPAEMSLEFENKIYEKFVILSKKRYAAISVNEDGKEDSKLLKRGIILQRRDNCSCLRETYQNAIDMVFKNHEKLVALKALIDPILTADNDAMSQWKAECARLKAERNREIAQDLLDQGIDPNSEVDGIPLKKARAKRGAKKKLTKKDLPPPPVPKARAVIMKDPIVLGLLKMIVFAAGSLFEWKYGYKSFVITKQIAKDVKEYKNPKRLPGHVQLGLRMAKRGVAIGGGTRIEYVILKNGPYCYKDTQTSKIEDVNYFMEFRDIFRISYLDYLKQFINPLDDLLKVVIGLEDFVWEHFRQRIKYSQVVDRIQELTRPRIEFEDGPRNAEINFGDEKKSATSKKTRKSKKKSPTPINLSLASIDSNENPPVTLSLAPFNANDEKKTDLKLRELPITSISCDGCCNSKTRGEGWGTVVDERGRDLLMPADNAFAYEGMTTRVEVLPMGTTRVIVAAFKDVAKQNNNGAELLALIASLRIALARREIRVINSDSSLIVDYWSKNRIAKDTRDKMDPDKLALIEECARLRIVWEETGGTIMKISGDDNIADPGFGHGTKTRDKRRDAMMGMGPSRAP